MFDLSALQKGDELITKNGMRVVFQYRIRGDVLHNHICDIYDRTGKYIPVFYSPGGECKCEGEDFDIKCLAEKKPLNFSEVKRAIYDNKLANKTKRALLRIEILSIIEKYKDDKALLAEEIIKLFEEKK